MLKLDSSDILPTNDIYGNPILSQIPPNLERDLSAAAVAKDKQTFRNALRENPEYVNAVIEFSTPLMIAVENNWEEMAEELLRRGCDPDLRARRLRPLEEAISQGNFEITKLLLDHGAKPRLENSFLDCMLLAITKGHTDIMRLLLERGTDPHVVHELADGRRRNALSLAKDWGRTDIVKLLEAAGCQMPDNSVKLDNPEADIEYLIHHLKETYGEVSPLAITSILPASGLEGVSIHLIRDNRVEKCMTLFTTGLSNQPMKLPEGEEDYEFAELMIHLPSDWPLPDDLSQASNEALWPIKWMLQVAAYPRRNKTWLGGQTTVISHNKPPQPLGTGTRFTCLLLLADFAIFSPLYLPSQKLLHLYSMIPIYTEERALERKEGVAELLTRFSDNLISKIVDEGRENVALL